MISQLESLTLTKGHGAGNDFVLVPDPDGALKISPEDVARICDRHVGIGGDGLIRVIRTRSLLREDPSLSDVLGHEPTAPELLPEWFMDYRNADGSIAEMCGNGVRVFVHYLRCQRLIDLELGGSVAVATRGGTKNVTFDAPDYTVDMGEYQLPFGPGGADTRVSIPGVGERSALSRWPCRIHTPLFFSRTTTNLPPRTSTPRPSMIRFPNSAPIWSLRLTIRARDL